LLETEVFILGKPETNEYLITGGAGFIGSHLSEALLARGASVVSIDDLSTGTRRNIRHLENDDNFRFIKADAKDETTLKDLASPQTIIVHLAAAVGVRLITGDPVHTIETNVMGSRAVLRCAAHFGCRVLLASTSEAYGKGDRTPFREGDDSLLGPTSKSRWSYAASKLVSEFLGLAYHKQFGVEVVPFRLFNTIGPRQTGRYGMVVPRFVRQALLGESITVYGDGLQTRTFCDVRDVVQALIGLALHPDSPGRIYNIGSNEEISIRALAERVKQITKSTSDIVRVPYEEVYGQGFEDIRRRAPDTTRIRQLIKWNPTRSLDKTIEEIVEFEQRKIRE
jgi:UDP-glucose 4-epimerase